MPSPEETERVIHVLSMIGSAGGAIFLGLAILWWKSPDRTLAALTGAAAVIFFALGYIAQ
jgi:hypothetical protein